MGSCSIRYALSHADAQRLASQHHDPQWDALADRADAVDSDRRRADPRAENESTCDSWEVAAVYLGLRTVALLLLCLRVAAVEWGAYDKQAHAAAGALMGYTVCDITQRIAPDLHPAWRWLIGTGSTAAAGFLYEELVGFRDPDDAIATSTGGAIGSTAQVGVSLILTPTSAALLAKVHF
jgi:hypothetical protein